MTSIEQTARKLIEDFMSADEKYELTVVVHHLTTHTQSLEDENRRLKDKCDGLELNYQEEAALHAQTKEQLNVSKSSAIDIILGESRALEEENKRLSEALEDLIFTSSALWDKVKSIKDGPCLRVTHPIIEQAREVLGKSA